VPRFYDLAYGETSIQRYSFGEADGVTTLVVELEVPDEWADDMRGMWSEAIVTIKRLAERA